MSQMGVFMLRNLVLRLCDRCEMNGGCSFLKNADGGVARYPLIRDASLLTLYESPPRPLNIYFFFNCANELLSTGTNSLWLDFGDSLMLAIS